MIVNVIFFCSFLSIISSTVIRLTDVTKAASKIKTREKSLVVPVKVPVEQFHLPANIPLPHISDEIVFQGALTNQELIGLIEKVTCPQPIFCIFSGSIGNEGEFSLTYRDGRVAYYVTLYGNGMVEVHPASTNAGADQIVYNLLTVSQDLVDRDLTPEVHEWVESESKRLRELTPNAIVPKISTQAVGDDIIDIMIIYSQAAVTALGGDIARDDHSAFMVQKVFNCHFVPCKITLNFT